MIIFPAGVGSFSNLSRDEFLDKHSLNLDGTDDYVSFDTFDGNDIIGTGDFTVSFWFKRTEISASETLLYIGESANNHDYFWLNLKDDGTLRVQFRVGSSGSFAINPTDYTTTINVWYNVLVTRTGQAVKLYLNGIEISSGSNVHVGANLGDTSSAMFSGRWRTAAGYLHGRIAQFGIWSRVLSSEEIQFVYDRPNNLGLNGNYKSYSSSGLVGYWPMLEGSGSTTIDRSFNTNDGTIATDATWSYATPSKSILEPKYSINFDGSDDYLQTNFAPSSIGTADYSISFWFNITAGATQDHPYFFAFGSDSDENTNSYQGLGLTGRSGNGYKVRINNYYGSEYSQSVSSSTSDVTAGTWYHFVLVRSGNTLTLYKDGVSFLTLTNSDVASNNLNLGSEFRIGYGYGAASTRYTNGRMDSFAIFNAALSKQEIKSIYNNGNLLDLSVDSGDYESSSNLVAYWRMNEGTGTSTKDVIGLKNGTLTNSPTWSKIVPFKADNYSVYLDGSDDIIDLSTFDPSSVIGTGAFTMSMWMKAHSDANQIFWYMGNSGITTMMRMNYLASSGGFKIWANIDGTWTDQYPHVDITTETGVWYHVAVVRSGTTVTLYVNATNSDSKTHSSLATGFGTEHHIGKYMTSHHLNGNIGQYALWNKALTSSEIASIYNDGTPIDLTSNYQNYNSINNLVGYWDMNEGSGDSLIAESVRTGMDFDGTDDYIEIADSNDLSFGDGSNDSSFTISAWANLDSAAFQRFITKSSASNAEWLFGTSSQSKLAFTLYDNTGSAYNYKVSTATISTGQWYHFVGTYNASSDEFTLYINGSVDSGSTGSLNYTAMHNTSAPVHIGKYASANQFNNGKLDDIAIWNTALPASDVLAIYNNGFPTDLTTNTADYRFAANLVGYWKMGNGTEAGSGTTIYDMSKNSNNGTITNDPTFIGTRIATLSNGPTWSNDSWNTLTKQTRNYSIDFDGTNDYVPLVGSLSAGTYNFFTSTLKYSVSIWFQLDDHTANASQVLLANNYTSNSGANAGIQVWYDNRSGHATKAIRVNSWAGTSVSTNTASAIGDNNWHHLVVTSSGASGTLAVYLDGASLATASLGSVTSTAPNQDLAIGGRVISSSVHSPINGKMKDVAIFNRALSSDAVKSIYNDGEIIDLTKDYGHYEPKNNLIAYYQMEEGEGTILMDRTGNGRNGTLTNGPTYSTSTP